MVAVQTGLNRFNRRWVHTRIMALIHVCPIVVTILVTLLSMVYAGWWRVERAAISRIVVTHTRPFDTFFQRFFRFLILRWMMASQVGLTDVLSGAAAEECKMGDGLTNKLSGAAVASFGDRRGAKWMMASRILFPALLWLAS